MNKRLFKIGAIITGAFMLTGFIDFRLATGFILGVLAAGLLYFRNSEFWNTIVDTGSAQSTTGVMHFFLNYAIMAGVLLAGALLPQYLNIYTCAAGMMIIKWSVYVDALLPHKEIEK